MSAERTITMNFGGPRAERQGVNRYVVWDCGPCAFVFARRWMGNPSAARPCLICGGMMEPIELTRGDLPLSDPSALVPLPSVKDSKTSRAAALKVYPKQGTQRQRILVELYAQGTAAACRAERLRGLTVAAESTYSNLVNGEGLVTVMPHYYRPGISRPARLVVLLHGANQLAIEIASYVTETRQLVQVLVDSAFVVIAPDAGGKTTFGSTLTITSIQQSILQAEAALGVLTDGVLTVGASMGNMGGLAWGHAHPEKARAHAGVIPAMDLEDLYTQNRAGFASSIAAAYGGAGNLPAAYPTHSPTRFAAQMTGLPQEFWYSSDDTIVPPATVTGYAAAAGAPAHAFGAVGHNVNGLPIADIAAFLVAHR